MLEKRLEEEELKINQIIEYLQKERNNRKSVSEKVEEISKKALTIIDQHHKKINQKLKIRNGLKTYVNKVCLFLEGVVTLNELRKFSRLGPE